MVKLVIFIQSAGMVSNFDDLWPSFLHLAEQMPGLQREATSRVDHVLFGKLDVVLIHELDFESLQALQEAMATGPGQLAGQVLQQLTRGHVVLFIADHREDDIENLRKYQARAAEPGDAPKDDPGDGEE